MSAIIRKNGIQFKEAQIASGVFAAVLPTTFVLILDSSVSLVGIIMDRQGGALALR